MAERRDGYWQGTTDEAIRDIREDVITLKKMFFDYESRLRVIETRTAGMAAVFGVLGGLGVAILKWVLGK